MTEVLDFMKTKVDVMKIHEKEYVLILDQMSITKSVDYDTSTSSYYGFVTLPEHYGQANHALVFMLGGISTRWKQTVAYYYTGSSVNGGVLKNIVLSIINCTEEIGLKINSVTSNMGAINQAMWKSFNISCTNIKRFPHCKSGIISSSIKHPCDPTRTIDFLADVPHLLKNIRTSLLCNKHFIITAKIQEKYKLQSPIIDSKHLNELVDH